MKNIESQSPIIHFYFQVSSGKHTKHQNHSLLTLSSCILFFG
jgi:hypothetical protein